MTRTAARPPHALSADRATLPSPRRLARAARHLDTADRAVQLALRQLRERIEADQRAFAERLADG